nr:MULTISPECIES: type I toxin-antitoxin system Ibs family toxin [Escherichia]
MILIVLLLLSFPTY